MAKRITVHPGGYLLLEDFEGLIDTNRVVFYKLKPKKDGTLVLKFYDAKKKIIKPYGK